MLPVLFKKKKKLYVEKKTSVVLCNCLINMFYHVLV